MTNQIVEKIQNFTMDNLIKSFGEDEIAENAEEELEINKQIAIDFFKDITDLKMPFEPDFFMPTLFGEIIIEWIIKPSKTNCKSLLVYVDHNEENKISVMGNGKKLIKLSSIKHLQKKIDWVNEWYFALYDTIYISSKGAQMKETKPVHLHIESEIYKSLKVYCAENDLKINSFISELIKNFLKEIKKWHAEYIK